MYLLSDFFIATPEDLAARDWSKSPVLTLPTVLARGVDFGKVLWLNAILFGAFDDPQMKTVAQLAMRVHLPHVPSDMPQWHDTVGRLAGLCEAQRQRCAEQWASLEGWDAHGVTAEQARAMFLHLANLAQQAVESDRGMYLWQAEYP